MPDFSAVIFAALLQAVAPGAPVAPQALPQGAVPVARAPLQTPAVLRETGASPSQVYEALVAQRREVRNELSQLESRRTSIAQRLRQGNAADGADRLGLEQRLSDLDKQIVETYGRVAEAEAAVTQQAAVPGAVVPPPPNPGPPEEVFVLGTLMILFVLFPLTIAFTRRLWRRGATAASALPGELSDRLSRLEETVESTAIEVERIGEGQRFITTMFVEHGPPMLNAPAPEPIPYGARERAAEERRELR